MKGIWYKSRYCFVLILFSAVCWLCFSVDVCSAESTNGFRYKYDIIMRWINFAIMVVIFFKYGYKPFLLFIKSQRAGIEKKISELEEKRKIVADELDGVVKMNEKNQVQLKKLRRRIMSEGEVKYQKIIEQAQQQSKMMLENAKRKGEVQIIEARNRVRNEVIDIAIKLAGERLKILVGDKSDNAAVDIYTEDILGGKSTIVSPPNPLR